MFVYYTYLLLALILCVKRGYQSPWIFARDAIFRLLASSTHTSVAASRDAKLVQKHFYSSKGRARDAVATY